MTFNLYAVLFAAGFTIALSFAAGWCYGLYRAVRSYRDSEWRTNLPPERFGVFEPPPRPKGPRAGFQRHFK